MEISNIFYKRMYHTIFEKKQEIFLILFFNEIQIFYFLYTLFSAKFHLIVCFVPSVKVKEAVHFGQTPVKSLYFLYQSFSLRFLENCFEQLFVSNTRLLLSV